MKWKYTYIKIKRNPVSETYEAYTKAKMLKGQEVLDYINSAGAEGWEMVSVVTETDNTNTTSQILWFKQLV